MSTAVIFDMDGTLFDTEAVFQKYWNAIAKERGIVLPDAFKYEICGTSGEVMNRIIEKQYRVKDARRSSGSASSAWQRSFRAACP